MQHVIRSLFCQHFRDKGRFNFLTCGNVAKILTLCIPVRVSEVGKDALCIKLKSLFWLEDCSDSPLYRLLYAKLPNHRSDTQPQCLGVMKIAEELGIRKQAIYGWFNRNRFPAKRIPFFCQLEGSRLEPEDLFPFIDG